MLTVARPPPSRHKRSHRKMIQQRGRSTNVSPVALARQASEERYRREADEIHRRVQLATTSAARALRLQDSPPCSVYPLPDSKAVSEPLTSAALCPASLTPVICATEDSSISSAMDIPIASTSTSATSTPSICQSPSSQSLPNCQSEDSYPFSYPSESAAQSLQDRMQHAYALDDIALAKSLLLTLRGVPDGDPAQVRDEDFDAYFVPHMLSDADCEKRRWQERCERMWEEGKKEMRAEKEKARAKRREDEEQRRRQRQTIVVSCCSSPPDPEPFQYSFMSTKALSTTPPHRRTTNFLSSQRPTKVIPAPLHPRAIAFKDILVSMQGPLFPPEPHATSMAKSTRRQDELLASLVQQDFSDWRSVKGEERAVPIPSERKSSTIASTCAACAASCQSLSSSSSSSSSTVPSRSGSWLSFSSSSVSTASTSPTTTSPISISSWLKKPSSSSPIATSFPARHSCLRTSRSLVAVDPADAPLTDTLVQQRPFTEHSPLSYGTPETLRVPESRGMMGRLFDFAKGFQEAYIHATMFSVTMVENGVHSHSPSKPVSALITCEVHEQEKTELKPVGSRASPAAVQTFTAAECSDEDDDILMPTCTYLIPLSPFRPSSARSPSPSPPSHSTRTLTLTFPPPPPLPRSPLRPLHPPSALEWRRRPVANPAALRLRALQNVLGQRWEEVLGVVARDGGMGCGRERLIGVAFEGIGRSGLGCEVRVVGR